MPSIAFVNAKGGAGKTTAALLFALALQQTSFEVVIDDRDINQVAAATAPRINLKLGKQARFVVIDTAGYLHDPALAEVVKTADLVVIVMSPTPTDLMVTRGTADYVRQQRSPDKKTAILFTRVQTNRFGSALDSFAAGLHFPVLKRVLRLRTNYPASQIYGWRALNKIERLEVIEMAIQLVGLVPEPTISPAAQPISG